MIIGNSEFNLNTVRTRTIIMVSIIAVFSVVILVMACLIYGQHKKQAHSIATIFCISFCQHSISCILTQCPLLLQIKFPQGIIVWVSSFQQSTSISYLCILVSTIVQFSSAGGITAKVQQIMVIVSASIIVLVGSYKNYYAYQYFMKGRQMLTQDIRDIRSILSVESYEQGLKNSLG